MKRTALTIGSLIVFDAMFVGSIFAQSKIRTLDQQKYKYKNEPLSVVAREIGEKSFPSNDNKLEAEPDWLKHLSLDVKNISSKNITFFEIHLVVYNPRKISSQDSITLRFTGWPTFKDNTDFVNRGGKRVSLRPGEVIKLSVREQLPPVLIKYLEGLEEQNFDRVSIDIRYVHFDDGTGWALGHETRQDPDRPGGWITVRDGPFSVTDSVSNWHIPFAFANPLEALARCLRPANGRVFFALQSSTTGCVWYNGTFPKACVEGSYSCTAPTGTCWSQEDRTYASQPPGESDYGYLAERPSICLPTPENPDQGVCSDCQVFQTQHWIAASEEICSPWGGVDDDCDGLIDEGFNVDGDGYEACEGDCNDTSPYIYPGAAEMCDCDTDQNCNGMDDENSTCQEVLGMGPQCNEGVWNWSALPNGCCAVGGVCYPTTPIVIDVNGNGFSLTDLANGVNFDLNLDGTGERLSWTSAGSDDAWLVLDRNGNGTIDDGGELFGNYTEQPRPTTIQPNGFIALAEYDKVSNGGNNDGQISTTDNVFDDLRLWQDVNHNGTSEPGELRSLSQLGLSSIDLKYKESKKTDIHGNKFMYRAKVRDMNGAQLGRWAWDVSLLTQPTP